MSSSRAKGAISKLAQLQVGRILRYGSDNDASGRIYLIVSLVQQIAMVKLFIASAQELGHTNSHCVLSSHYGLIAPPDASSRLSVYADATRLIIKEVTQVQSLLSSGAFRLLRKVHKPDLLMVLSLLRRATTLSQVEKDIFL